MHRCGGFTLVEMLIVLMLVMLTVRFGVYLHSDFIPRQQLVADTNQTLGLIQHARARSLTEGPVLVCDKSTKCEGFTGNRLVAINDHNKNGQWDETEKVIARLAPHAGTRIYLRSFGKQEYLGFSARGITNFQNGSLYLCHGKYARRIILTWAGEARVAPRPADPEKCSPL